MDITLFDSELKVMEVLWKNGDTSAKEIARQLGEVIGWSKTTTYTVIKKCIDKGAIERSDPGFICHALITKEAARERETMELVDKMFDGSSDLLVASLISGKKIGAEQLSRLRQLIIDSEEVQR